MDDAEKINDGDATISPPSKRKYTEATRGVGKYKGWSRSGIKLYNKLDAKLEEQRNDPELGSAFDKKLKEYFVITSGGAAATSTTEEEAINAVNNFARKRRAMEGNGIVDFTGQQESV